MRPRKLRRQRRRWCCAPAARARGWQPPMARPPGRARGTTPGSAEAHAPGFAGPLMGPGSLAQIHRPGSSAQVHGPRYGPGSHGRDRGPLDAPRRRRQILGNPGCRRPKFWAGVIGAPAPVPSHCQEILTPGTIADASVSTTARPVRRRAKPCCSCRRPSTPAALKRRSSSLSKFALRKSTNVPSALPCIRATRARPGLARRRSICSRLGDTRRFSATGNRAALAWTEALTLLPEQGAPDALYEEVRAEFSVTDIVNLTLAVVAINGWNRLAAGFNLVPPTAQVTIAV